MPEDPASSNPEGILFERRRFVRVSGTFVVSYVDVTAREVKSDITQTKNISVGGIFFTTDRKFPADTILKLRLRLPDAPNYINVKVRVIDSKQRVKDVLYETRAKFVSIRDEDRDYVSKMVEYCIEKEREKKEI